MRKGLHYSLLFAEDADRLFAQKAMSKKMCIVLGRFVGFDGLVLGLEIGAELFFEAVLWTNEVRNC